MMNIKVMKKQFNSGMCFVCGFQNDLGLKTMFYELENKSLCALATLRDIHQGYPGRVHGGVAASILDETIGRAMMAYSGEDVWGVTRSLNIKYKKPVPYNEELRIVGKITMSNGMMYEGEGYILLPDDTIAVEAKGRYVQMSLEKISTMDPHNEEEWVMLENENDPKEIKILQW